MCKKYISLILIITFITACSGNKSVKVVSLQKKDKSLNCSEIQLEINEAEFYRNTAENNKNPGIKSLLMPIGYISSYVDADDASHAAEARVKYLNRIYDILDCDNPNSTGNMRTTSSYQQLGTVVNPHYAPVHSSQDYYHETEPTNGEWHY